MVLRSRVSTTHLEGGGRGGGSRLGRQCGLRGRWRAQSGEEVEGRGWGGFNAVRGKLSIHVDLVKLVVLYEKLCAVFCRSQGEMKTADQACEKR